MKLERFLLDPTCIFADTFNSLASLTADWGVELVNNVTDNDDSIDFDGADAFISLGAEQKFQMTQDFSVVLDFNMNSLPPGDYNFVAKDDTNGLRGWRFCIESDLTCRFTKPFNNGTGSNNFDSVSPIVSASDVGNWVTLGFSCEYDGVNLVGSFYRNGELFETDTVGNIDNDTPEQNELLFSGRNRSGTRCFGEIDGKLRNIYITKRSIPAYEMKALYDKRVFSNNYQDKLIRYYDMDRIDEMPDTSPFAKGETLQAFPGALNSDSLVDGPTPNGKAIDFGIFDGETAGRFKGDVLSLDDNTQLTVFAWVKNTSDDLVGAVVSQYDLGIDERSWLLDITSNGQIRVTMSDDGTFNAGHRKRYNSALGELNKDVWSLIGFSFYKGELNLYIDGRVLQLTDGLDKELDDNITTIHGSSAEIVINAYLSNNNPANKYDGAIGPVYIYNKGFTPFEAADFYHQSKFGRVVGN